MDDWDGDCGDAGSGRGWTTEAWRGREKRDRTQIGRGGRRGRRDNWWRVSVMNLHRIGGRRWRWWWEHSGHGLGCGHGHRHGHGPGLVEEQIRTSAIAIVLDAVRGYAMHRFMYISLLIRDCLLAGTGCIYAGLGGWWRAEASKRRGLGDCGKGRGRGGGRFCRYCCGRSDGYREGETECVFGTTGG